MSRDRDDDFIHVTTADAVASMQQPMAQAVTRGGKTQTQTTTQFGLTHRQSAVPSTQPTTSARPTQLATALSSSATSPAASLSPTLRPSAATLSATSPSGATSASLRSPKSARSPLASHRRRESRLAARLTAQLSHYPLLSYLEQKTGVNRLYLASGLLGGVILFLVCGLGLQLMASALGFCYPLWRSVQTVEILRRSDPDDDDSESEYSDSDADCDNESMQRAATRRSIASTASPTPSSYAGSSSSTSTSPSTVGITQVLEDRPWMPRSQKVALLRHHCIYWMIYGLLTMFESISDTILSWLPWYRVVKVVLLVWCFSGGGAQLLYAFLLRPLLHRHQGILAESASITHNVYNSTRETSQDVLAYVRQKKLSLHSLAQMTISSATTSQSSASSSSAAVSPQPVKSPTSLFTIHDESAQPSSAISSQAK